MISPKFKGMFGKDDNEYKKGYYGPFSFFNSQHEFHQVFGNKPIILQSNPMGGSNGGIKDKIGSMVKNVNSIFILISANRTTL